ncbi:MAG: 6-bladed beta-propeller, partial [Prevotella sp.]|nr:6-bladed beta-propeller [Prevotella sp.]
MNKLILISLLCLLVSCADKNEHDCQIIIFDEDKSEIQSESPQYTFIPLETRPDNLIAHITKVEIVDNRIFTLDMRGKNVQVFDMDGKFIAQVGAVGDAPGEYAAPHKLYINEAAKTITIIDHVKNRYMLYDLDTYQHLSTREIPFYFTSYTPLSDGNHAWFYRYGYKKARDLYYIQITDSLFHIHAYHHGIEHLSPSVIAFQELFYPYDNKIFFHYPFTPIIYEVTSDGLKAVYELSIATKEFPSPEYLASVTPNESADQVMLASGYIAGYAVLETSQYIALFYLVKKRMGIGIYNKEKQKSYQYVDFMESTLLNGVNFPFVGTYNEHFIATISPGEMKNRRIRNDELRNLSERISE